MTREEILQNLLEQLGDGVWGLAILKREGTPINKEKFRDLINDYYQENRETDEKLIKSRHTLDIFAARLEGAGLVRVSELGRAKVYTLSQLGEELIKFRETRKNR